MIQMKMKMTEMTTVEMKNRLSLIFNLYFNGKSHHRIQSMYQTVTHDRAVNMMNFMSIT